MRYKCEHKSETIFTDDNSLTISAYLIWKDSVGFNGNKTLCWDCYCKQEVKWTS